MRLLARAVVLGVVALLFATPLMACAMEAAQMSVSEAECCKAMAGDCHDQVGPASHKCCRTIASVPDSSKPVRAAGVAPAAHAMLAAPVVVPAPVNTAVVTCTTDTSPPGSPPVCSSILRI
jgi:hypothetical protein